jgi:transcriptional/translational regulatory protein YebC/TACO1
MGAQWKQKHRELAANAKGRIMTKLVKELQSAARSGTDPAANPRLRMAIDAAKRASMAKETLEQVPVIVECLTDNKNRTATNIRVHFSRGGGQLGGSGSVSWDFDRLGAVEASPPSRPGLDPEEEAIEAGANELDPPEDDGSVTFYTGPTDLDRVAKALAERGWTVTAANLIWKSKNPVSPDDEKRARVEAFLEAVDGDDDVQAVYVGLV